MGQNALDAMVAAYNRAIDDAVELWYNPSPEAMSIESDLKFDQELEQLKIRD